MSHALLELKDCFFVGGRGPPADACGVGKDTAKSCGGCLPMHHVDSNGSSLVDADLADPDDFKPSC